MTHHQFGSMAGDTDMGGIVDASDTVLLDEWTTVAIETIQQGEVAGNVAGALFGAAERLPAPSPNDFRLGLSEGVTR